MSDDIDSGRTRAAGRREHVNMPLPHMVAKGKVGFMSASVTTTMGQEQACHGGTFDSFC